jgi:dienelactone hydrolase
MKRLLPLRAALLLLILCPAALSESTIFRTIDELWRGYDPRALPLETETVAEEKSPDGILRTVYYTGHVENGFKVRVLGYYGFPPGARKLPGILHIHGGGQNATKEYVRYWVKRGYAALSINWGGIPQSDPKLNTDWGPLHAYQLDRTYTYRTMPDTRANPWYKWTIACRRGLTFLEQQPEVDGSGIGIFGVSMGGRLTWLVAGSDARVKAAASVYGAVSMEKAIAGHPGSEQVHFESPEEAAVWGGSLDARAYAPRIRCPFLFLSASDDFYGAMDFVDEAIGLIPHKLKWQAFSPHFNHHVAAREAADLPRWMDLWLKHGEPFPESPVLRIELKKAGVARAVLPEQRSPVAGVNIYYSTDAYPQSRFWRTAEVSHDAHGWTAPLPVSDGSEPLRAFANVSYRNGLSLSTRLLTVARQTLRQHGIRPVEEKTSVIDDFSAGARDWFVPQAGPNLVLSTVEPFRIVDGTAGGRAVTFAPGAWSIATRKLGDPRWSAPAGAALQISVKAESANSFYVIATENEFRRDRKTRVFLAPAKVEGGGVWQTIVLRPADFRLAEGEETLPSWDQVNLLWLAPQYSIRDQSTYPFTTRRLGQPWQGASPVFGRMEWKPAVKE